MANNWQEMLAELRVAIKRENDIRDAAFLDLNTNICGVEIRQMTPRDMLILDGIGNPVMSGELPTPAQLAEFLWFLSPKFSQHAPIRRFMFGRRIRKLNYIEAVRACWKYVEDTFQDSPGTPGLSSMPYASWCSHLITSLSENPATDAAVILNTPLKCLFQYLKCRKRKTNPEAIVHNPSDKVKGDFIRLQNARTQLVNVLKRRAN